MLRAILLFFFLRSPHDSVFLSRTCAIISTLFLFLLRQLESAAFTASQYTRRSYYLIDRGCPILLPDRFSKKDGQIGNGPKYTLRMGNTGWCIDPLKTTQAICRRHFLSGWCAGTGTTAAWLCTEPKIKWGKNDCRSVATHLRKRISRHLLLSWWKDFSGVKNK